MKHGRGYRVCLEHFFKTWMKETEQIRRRWEDNNNIVRNELDCRVRERSHLPKLQSSGGHLLTYLVTYLLHGTQSFLRS